MSAQLQKIEFIDSKLLQIREILDSEDGYQVCDFIIANIADELLADSVTDMLVSMGYGRFIQQQIMEIIKQIQK